jgi:hypothetical protein
VRFRGHPEGEWLASAHALAVDHCEKGAYSPTLNDNEDKYLAMVEKNQRWCHASGPGGVPNDVFRGEPFWDCVRPNVFM